MDCNTTVDRMDAYLNDHLTDKELVSFTDHIKKCSSCREELEIYYISDLAGKTYRGELEELPVLNLEKMLEDDMQKRLAKMHKRHMGMILLWTMALCVLLLSAYGVGNVLKLW